VFEGEFSKFWKPVVENQRIQWLANYLNGLLAADSLQNSPDTLQRSILD
jgi:hypothetical protein